MLEQPPVTDNQLRGRVLTLFYQHRRDRWHESDGADVNPAMPPRDFVDICLQLETHGLLQVMNKKLDRGSVAAVGAKITAFGIDAVESGGAKSPITIVFNVNNAGAVQIGNNNTQLRSP